MNLVGQIVASSLGRYLCVETYPFIITHCHAIESNSPIILSVVSCFVCSQLDESPQ